MTPPMYAICVWVVKDCNKLDRLPDRRPNASGPKAC
jgi:hypothetical protein